VTPAYWENRMAVNLRHIYFCSQAAVPGMQAKGGGVILNFSSISWHLALPDLTLYMGAKAAIEGMTRGMARDLGGDNIRVNAIIPGGVRTPRQEALWHTPEEEARILAGHACRSAWRSPTWRPWRCSWPRTVRRAAPAASIMWTRDGTALDVPYAAQYT
jgi:NAD(P)-dependent dehydrogenase (short-subunit alcohol dehydrogenase family)